MIGRDAAFPVLQQDNANGSIVQYAEKGMDIDTYATIEFMKSLMLRVDAKIYQPSEIAAEARKYTQALLDEIK